MDADTFGKWLREQREAAHFSQQEVADAAGVQKSFISKLETATKHTTTGASPSPSLATFLAIIKKLNVPVTAALEKLGHGEGAAADLELHKLQTYFKELPRECQLDVLALTEALWRRRRAEGKAEERKAKSAGKRQVRVDYPREGRPGRKRNAG